jgi:hypothetical protein
MDFINKSNFRGGTLLARAIPGRSLRLGRALRLGRLGRLSAVSVGRLLAMTRMSPPRQLWPIHPVRPESGGPSR